MEDLNETNRGAGGFGSTGIASSKSEEENQMPLEANISKNCFFSNS